MAGEDGQRFRLPGQFSMICEGTSTQSQGHLHARPRRQRNPRGAVVQEMPEFVEDGLDAAVREQRGLPRHRRCEVARDQPGVRKEAAILPWPPGSEGRHPRTRRLPVRGNQSV